MTKHILVVDDEELVGEALKDYLELAGYAVQYATDGAEALKLAAQQQQVGKPFDIGISDVRMPGMDGVTLSRKLYRRYELPMLLITGYPLEDEAMRQSDSGVRGLVYKPFVLPELTAKLQEFFAER